MELINNLNLQASLIQLNLNLFVFFNIVISLLNLWNQKHETFNDYMSKLC